MESVHLGKPPPGFTGNFDLSLDAEYGNTEKSSASTGIKLQSAEDNKTDFLLVNYEYGESAGVRDTNKSFLHLRHIQQFMDIEQTAWEIFAQLSSNEFTRLNLRALAGGGMRFTFGKLASNKALIAGAGGFYEREDLDVVATGSDEETESAVRGNLYLVLKYKFNQHVTFVSSTYYQPALDEFSDFRAIENASFVSKLTDDLSLKAGLNVRHDSDPPVGVRVTDTSVRFGLSLGF